MNSVLMRFMSDSAIKKLPFSLPCLPRVPSEYLAGFSFSVSLSLLSVLPVSSPVCLSLPFSLSCFFFSRLHSAFFPLTFAVRGGEARVRPPFSFSFPFLARRGFPAVRECPCWFSIRPFRLSGCGPFSSPAGPFCGAFPFPPPFRPAWPLAPCNPFSHFPMFRAVCALRAAPRPGPRPVPAARPVWGPYGKAPRFPPALRFVCFCENFPLPAQKSPPFFWPSAFFVLPLHPLSPSSGPCARGGVVL